MKEELEWCFCLLAGVAAGRVILKWWHSDT